MNHFSLFGIGVQVALHTVIETHANGYQHVTFDWSSYWVPRSVHPSIQSSAGDRRHGRQSRMVEPKGISLSPEKHVVPLRLCREPHPAPTMPMVFWHVIRSACHPDMISSISGSAVAAQKVVFCRISTFVTCVSWQCQVPPSRPPLEAM